MIGLSSGCLVVILFLVKSFIIKSVFYLQNNNLILNMGEKYNSKLTGQKRRNTEDHNKSSKTGPRQAK
jgi:hypothetical protein